MSGNSASSLLRYRSLAAGFGLIELMVSISIMVLVMGAVLTRQGSFNSASLLRTQAYNIALEAREMQLTAVSSESRGGGTNFRAVYGVHFSIAIDNRFYAFRDNNNNNFWNDTEELPLLGSVDPRFEIRSVTAFNNADVPTSITTVSIVYERPNFDARFYSAANTQIAGAVRVEVVVGIRGGGASRTIVFTKTGQISVI